MYSIDFYSTEGKYIGEFFGISHKKCDRMEQSRIDHVTMNNTTTGLRSNKKVLY